ncbi:unnamed protein product [Acanthoscelides obtectus]|uniref:PiggyBac transposable element-derived protein domain-containing protein n=1 Tax=Acanthoscelides obtectus TaxID=200917 RepID=A0A9P0Q8W4_ACAOB|nr:unnamed protein product [Acanthoscelides obtectus]CAK1689555.1 hypothetical protein AOBTE_LOCUS37337 [Acanthoscelides obtectus]
MERHKRAVLVLSTCHTDDTVQVQRRGHVIHKPKAIIDYNRGKSSIDISDQMLQYCSTSHNSVVCCARKHVYQDLELISECCQQVNSAILNGHPQNVASRQVF